jgi:hypothetical protein
MTESAIQTAPAGEGPSTNGSTSRQARLAAAVANLRTRRQIPIERWLFIAGAVMLPLGVAFILLAWYGAAHKPLIIQQFPYLISGGVLGLGLMFAGGFLYFGYWITRLVQENRRHTEQLLAALGRLEGRLGEAPDATPTGNGTLVATATGTMRHRPDCPVVVGRQGLRKIKAGAKGFDPCKICDPEVADRG